MPSNHGLGTLLQWKLLLRMMVVEPLSWPLLLMLFAHTHTHTHTQTRTHTHIHAQHQECNSVRDVISTLKYDLQLQRNKIEVEKIRGTYTLTHGRMYLIKRPWAITVCAQVVAF